MSEPPAATGPQGQPDILFLYSDQHARNVIGHAGDPIAITPNLDRLAQSGVWFDSAYCPSPICTPSRMSTLTGQWPHEQGVLDPGGPVGVRPADLSPTLWEQPATARSCAGACTR